MNTLYAIVANYHNPILAKHDNISQVGHKAIIPLSKSQLATKGFSIKPCTTPSMFSFIQSIEARVLFIIGANFSTYLGFQHLYLMFLSQVS